MQKWTKRCLHSAQDGGGKQQQTQTRDIPILPSVSITPVRNGAKLMALASAVGFNALITVCTTPMPAKLWLIVWRSERLGQKNTGCFCRQTRIDTATVHNIQFRQGKFAVVYKKQRLHSPEILWFCHLHRRKQASIITVSFAAEHSPAMAPFQKWFGCLRRFFYFSAEQRTKTF